MQKLTVIKKKTKESKERTKMNAHKLEWHKQFRNMEKRCLTLDEELSQFIQTNPLLTRDKQSMTKQSTMTKTSRSLVESEDNSKTDFE